MRLHQEFDLDLDPVTYQVLRNRFWAINLDHSDTIRRVSGSPVIVYMDDFNTALLTETADLVMAGPSIQWFAAVGDLPIKWTLENRGANPGIGPGDVFFTNDPWIGCIHAMDVGMFAPVFWEGRIFSWIFSQCHVGDVGGPFPGSFNPIADDLYQEPALVPPIKLVRGGELQHDVLEMHTRKSRTPDHLALQLRSQMAGINTVQSRMAEVLSEYGPAVVKGAMRRMIRDASRAIGERLLRIPDGEWEERIYMSGLAAQDRSAHRFVTRLRKTGDQLVFSNAGTDPQLGSASSVYGTWRSASIVALSNFLGWDQLLCNAGALDHISLEPTAGTLTVAKYPAATTGVGGNNASVYLPSYVISKMLMSGPEDLQRRANAAGGSAVVSFWFGAGLDRHGRFAVQAPGDVVAGALGAFPQRDGVDIGGAWWWPNNPSGNVEEWEDALPVLYLYRRERAGQWRRRTLARRQCARDGALAAQDRRDAGADHQRRQCRELCDRPRRRLAGAPGRLPLQSGRDPGRAAGGRVAARFGRRAAGGARRAAARVRQGPDEHAPRGCLRRAVQRRWRVRRSAGANARARRRRRRGRGPLGRERRAACMASC